MYISLGVRRNSVKFSGYLLRSMYYSVVRSSRYLIYARFDPLSQIQSHNSYIVNRIVGRPIYKWFDRFISGLSVYKPAGLVIGP